MSPKPRSPKPRSPKPRVLMISAADGGGVRRLQVTIGGALARDCEIMLATPAAGAPFLDQLPGSIPQHVLGSKKRPVGFARRLLRVIREVRPDVVIASQDQIIVPLAFLTASGLMSVPVIGWVHNNFTVHAAARRRLARTIPHFIRFAYGRLAHIVAVGGGIGDNIVERGYARPDAVSVVYNPIVLPTPEERAAPSPVEGRFMLNVGNLNLQKDQMTLLAAFAALAQSYPGKLVILGEGQERAALEQAAAGLGIADRVLMPGFRAPGPYYANADLFVLSSGWEGMPLAPIEAMSYGCQVASTDCDFGPREITEGGRLGRLCPVGDPPALARAMTAALAEPVDPGLLRARAEAFTLDQACGRFREIIDEVRGG